MAAARAACPKREAMATEAPAQPLIKRGFLLLEAARC